MHWLIETVDTEGFEFGLDEVTPVSWKLRRCRRPSCNALYSLILPEPKDGDDLYHAWLKGNRGKLIFHSVVELRCMIQTMKEIA